MFMLEYRSVRWWYWLVTVGCLTAGLAGQAPGFVAAIAVTVVQLVHVTAVDRRASFPVQVRLAYLGLLLLALPAPLRWVYWAPTIGTWALIVFGYCTMARMVSLLPWNRTEPFSASLLRRTFLSAPVRGSILHGRPARRPAPAGGADERQAGP